MDAYKALENKTIKSFEQDFDGENSYVIIKFNDGSKADIVAFPHGKEETAQIALTPYKTTEDKLVGKKIASVKEEFDGEDEHLTLEFKDGSGLDITAYSSGEEDTAGLSVDVYSAPVKESTKKNNRNEMENDLYFESLNEFARRGRPKKATDDVYVDDEEFDVEPEQISDVELEDEVSDLALQNRLKRALDNELKVPEYGRAHLQFIYKPTKQRFDAVPLAKLSGGKAYLFKTDDGLKKINLNDILLEESIQYDSDKKAFLVSESFEDYV